MLSMLSIVKGYVKLFIVWMFVHCCMLYVYFSLTVAYVKNFIMLNLLIKRITLISNINHHVGVGHVSHSTSVTGT